jgi:hypothetical protein
MTWPVSPSSASSFVSLRACTPIAGVASIVAAATLALAVPSPASAALTLLKPSPTDAATFSGHGGYSADGLGQAGTGGTVQAEVPAGSAVQRAYLYGTYTNIVDTTDPPLADRTIDFDGASVVLEKISDVTSPGLFLSTARAEVTTQVAAKVGGGGGITNFAVNTDPASLEGVALVVIYSNATLPLTTVAVLDGSASQTGETATFTLADPLDKSAPGFAARMSLASGFSAQDATGHNCSLNVITPGGPQVSTVNVNGQLLTGCAGNYDDGVAANGALVTVGGVGDSTDNPTPPDNPPTDDELYDIAPFLNQGDTQLAVTSSNPSQDDNLFLAVIQIGATASVTTEICSNAIDDDGDTLVDGADPDCGAPVTVDPTPPPPNPDGSRTFDFSSSDPAATFECSLDAAAFTPCTPPAPVPVLPPGPHTFTVRAVNASGTPGPASVVPFTVSAPPTGGGSGGGSPAATASGAPSASVAQALPPPTLAKTANLEPVRGTVRVRLPGSSTFILLSDARQIPMGSIVDTTQGEVRLTTASGPSGTARTSAVTQTANFYDGVFRLSQERRGLTDLRLVGGRGAACLSRNVRRSAASDSRRRKRSKKGKVRKLWGNGSGDFRTSGHYSSATVRGTTWLVEDRCEGTLTKVTQGVVAVRDFVRRRTITLRAPKSYLARAKRPRR